MQRSTGLGSTSARVDFKVDVVGAAAGALGLDKATLIKDVRNGDSLKTIAGNQGKNYADVSKAIHDAAKTDLDALVTAGKMVQTREDSILTNLDKWLAAGGTLPARWLGPPLQRPRCDRARRRPADPLTPLAPRGRPASRGAASSISGRADSGRLWR